MATIKIEWLTDHYDNCETCGSSYAEGARVFVDDAMVLDLAPVAHCHSGVNYDQQDVYERLLRHLGHTVEQA